MAKPKLEIDIEHYGEYEHWETRGKGIPKLKKITSEIEAAVDVEFGYVLRIKKGRGKKINFTIHHPPFKDEDGKTEPPFRGEVYVRTNDYQFFLGDTVWAPVESKRGAWRLVSEIEGKVIADMTLQLV